MSDFENSNVINTNESAEKPEQKVEVETNGQLRIVFEDENEEISESSNDDNTEKKQQEPVKEEIKGIEIHVEEDEDEWKGENPDYTGDYTDSYRNR